MCLPRGCCHSFSLKTGCFIVAYMNMIIAMAIGGVSTFLLALDPGQEFDSETGHVTRLSYLGANKRFSDAVLLGTLVLSVFGVVFSMLLILGIIKKKSGFILCYFLFGVFQAILVFILTLLELLHNIWHVAFVQVIVMLLYVYGLQVILKTYEDMFEEQKRQASLDYIDEAFLIENEVNGDQ